MATQAVVMYGCDMWPVILRDKHRMRVFETGALRRTFGRKSNEVSGENCIMRSIVDCCLYQILEGSNQDEMDRARSMHGREVHTEVRYEDQKERDQQEKT
jgi:hypothetical protein